MEKPLVIIKLGGSVITYKDTSTVKIRKNTIENLCKELRSLVRQNKYHIILVHGAGSFGHPLATRYQLQNGDLNKNRLFGFSLTVAKMIELNSFIVQSLLNNQLPAISLPPHAFATQINKKLINFDYKLIKEYLDKGFLPVLFGDVVLDEKQECSILSGDTIMAYLAKRLIAKKVIFLSDVDGVFDSDPKINHNAKLIPKVTNNNLKQVLSGLSVNNKNDVTGQMEGKILEVKKHLSGIKVIITNGLKNNSLITASEGHIGTELHFE